MWVGYVCTILDGWKYGHLLVNKFMKKNVLTCFC